MIFPLLSHFNHHSGPMIFLKAPELGNSIHLDHIPALMDLYNKGFFIHEYGGIRSANQIFEIPNPLTRGKAEILMISLVSFDEKFNLNSFQEILQFFVIQFREIPDVYKVFHLKSQAHSNEMNDKFLAILDFFQSFNQLLPKKDISFMNNINKMLTYSLSNLGKQKILKDLENSFIQMKQSYDWLTKEKNFDLF